MYCPTCRGEYREGITTCPRCDVGLRETLPEVDVIQAEEETVAVGTSGEHTSLRVVEVGGRRLDVQKAFTYDVASELVRNLELKAIPAILRPIGEVRARGQQPHFEVHVRPADEAQATQILHALWTRMVEEEGGRAVDANDIEHCPACGATVPLDVAECPDCGLAIGAAEGGEPEEDEEA